MKLLTSAALSATVLFTVTSALAQQPAATAPASHAASAQGGVTVQNANLGKQVTTAIKPELKGQMVTLAGTVEKFQAARTDRAPNSFTLRDAAGTIRVAIWNDVFAQVAGKEQLKDGARVEVKGEVALFRDTPELHVNSATDVSIQGATQSAAPAGAAAAIAPASTPPAASSAAPPASAAAPAASAPASTQRAISPISELTKDKLGQIVTINGKVTSARKPSTETAPYVFKVSDASGSIDVVFWKDLAGQLAEGQKLDQGDQARLTGKLSEYRGNLQLQISEKSGIQTPKTDPTLFQGSPAPAAGTPQAAAQKVSLDQFAAAKRGERVQIEGRVAAIEPVRTGRKVTVEDGKAKANVLLWDTAEGLVTAVRTLKPQDKITLAGKVDQVAGSPVLVVSRPEDVLSVAP